MEKKKDVNKNTAELEQGYIDPDELEIAKQDAAENVDGIYVHEFRKPFMYDGKEYKKLTFEFDDLTGGDTLAIERELTRKGITVIVPEFNGDYLAAMASRACTDEIGTDAFEHMSLRDFNAIRTAGRRFLLNLEQS